MIVEFGKRKLLRLWLCRNPLLNTHGRGVNSTFKWRKNATQVHQRTVEKSWRKELPLLPEFICISKIIKTPNLSNPKPKRWIKFNVEVVSMWPELRPCSSFQTKQDNRIFRPLHLPSLTKEYVLLGMARWRCQLTTSQCLFWDYGLRLRLRPSLV